MVNRSISKDKKDLQQNKLVQSKHTEFGLDTNESVNFSKIKAKNIQKAIKERESKEQNNSSKLQTSSCSTTTTKKLAKKGVNAKSSKETKQVKQDKKKERELSMEKGEKAYTKTKILAKYNTTNNPEQISSSSISSENKLKVKSYILLVGSLIYKR